MDNNSTLNKDGLRYPSIDELLTKIDSKYKLAYTAAKRAKIINKEEYTPLDDEEGALCATSVGIALEEINANKIQVEFMDTAEDAKPQNTFGNMDVLSSAEVKEETE